MINLRKEIHKILDEYGHYVLLQRTSRKIRCICWDEKYQESSIELYIKRTKYNGEELKGCPRCLGKGWVSRIERHKVRRENASQIINLPNLKKQMNIGQISSDARVFWFMHNVQPKRGDMIYEVGWDRHKPTHLIQSYEISYPEDVRGDNGRIEFWEAVAKEKNVDNGMKKFTIRQIGPVKNYEILY